MERLIFTINARPYAFAHALLIGDWELSADESIRIDDVVPRVANCVCSWLYSG